MEKVLNLTIRGERYKINSKGDIIRTDIEGFEPSGNWKFLGVSTHWKQNHIVHSFDEIFNNPKLALKGYFWDKDHGTTRTWGGQYNGGIPKITSAYIG